MCSPLLSVVSIELSLMKASFTTILLLLLRSPLTHSAQEEEPTKSSTATETMRWDELEGDFMHHNEEQDTHQQEQHDSSYLNFDSLSLISKPKDYYRILEVDYEATEEEIRSNYIRLALKWHPDKQKGEDGATSKFQEINEAYQVLSDPIRKQEYDKKGMLYLYDYNIVDYLNRYKGLILTCNGLGMKTSIL